MMKIATKIAHKLIFFFPNFKIHIFRGNVDDQRESAPNVKKNNAESLVKRRRAVSIQSEP
jgi:hypothetical protein